MERWVSLAAAVVESLGVAVIVLGAPFAAWRSLRRLRVRGASFRGFRQDLGRAILVGLELLVGADIIRTVSERPELLGVLVLGLIVLIRTFLSFILELEVDGRWPWERDRPPAA